MYVYACVCLSVCMHVYMCMYVLYVCVPAYGYIYLCVIITRLAAELTSIVCQGSHTRFTEFLVYDRNGQKRYSWTAANKLCQANNATLPTGIGFTGNNFSTSCISHLLQRFPTLHTESLYLWKQPCDATVHHCPALTFDISNDRIWKGDYPHEHSFGDHAMALPLCEKGENYYLSINIGRRS